VKKIVLAFMFTVLLGNTQTFADSQTFNAYGVATDSGKAALNVGTSVAFPGFTLDTTGFSLQLDPPGWFGAPNYELLGNQGDLTIDFTVPQSSFSIRLRDFKGFAGTETITVFGADDSTVLSTYTVGMNGSIITSTDSGESAPIGAVNLAEISGQFWTGALQSVTFSTSDPTPEPGSLSLLAIGVFGLAGMVRRKSVREFPHTIRA
jgi:hypothetical protein